VTGAAAPKPREPVAQLVHALGFHGVDAVVDVGANEGQYAASLRAHGWAGPIVSVEPVPEVHARLAARAAADPAWTVLPPFAAGASEGEAVLEVSAESDMSSLLPQVPLLRRVSPTSAITRRITVPLRRLDSLDLPGARPFLKLDLQGGESAALDGAERLLPRLAGLQLELALVPLYEGEPGWRGVVDRLEALGFALHLLIPGYYERKLGRQVQVDGVFFRSDSGRTAGDVG
jgi:FkbM family methyltransferase